MKETVLFRKKVSVRSPSSAVQAWVNGFEVRAKHGRDGAVWESGRGGPETGWRLWRTGYILGHSAFAVRVRTIACHDPCVRPLLFVMALAWKYHAV